MKRPTEEMIEQMKKNRVVYGLLTQDEHACLEFVGPFNVLMFANASDYKWIPYAGHFKPYVTYRIKSNYQLPSEETDSDLIICDVYKRDRKYYGMNTDLYEFKVNGDTFNFSDRDDLPGYLGVEYLEYPGKIFPATPMIEITNTGPDWFTLNDIENIESCVTLTPHKVYSRKVGE